MGEEELKKEENKKERRFDPELLKEGLRCDLDQYERLERCSGKKDMTEWNSWRENNLNEDVLLEGAYFSAFYLKGVHLESRGITSLEEEGTIDTPRRLHSIVYLKGAYFVFAELQEAKFMLAVLYDAEFGGAKLQGAKFTRAILHKADFENAELEGADFCYTELQGVNFETAIVDGETLIWQCKVNQHNNKSKGTDFSGVGLDSARIDPGTKQLLKYNIRRMNWEKWYKEHWFWRWPVRAFWSLSDYGRSTGWVIAWFFILALIFAGVYLNWAGWFPPGIIHNLEVQPEIGEAAWHYFLRAPVRAVYFSIVTMTTLGFGDMYANKGSIAGHVILAVQVILGYVLLGALITRFAVLFTAGGPAGKFAESGKGPD